MISLRFVQNNLPSLVKTESIEDTEPTSGNELEKNSHS